MRPDSRLWPEGALASASPRLQRNPPAFLGRPIAGIDDLHGLDGEIQPGEGLAAEGSAFHEILDLLEISAGPFLLQADELPARLAIHLLGDIDAVELRLVG